MPEKYRGSPAPAELHDRAKEYEAALQAFELAEDVGEIVNRILMKLADQMPRELAEKASDLQRDVFNRVCAMLKVSSEIRREILYGPTQEKD